MRRAEKWIDPALLTIITYLAVFLHSLSFGLYEDDWARVPRVAHVSLPELRDVMMPILTMEKGQGRPLHDCLIYLLSFAGWKLGGLEAIYLIGCAILALNAVLFYFFLRRVSPSRFFALTGALMFCLFPADTTRPFLTHALGLQPSLTFLLLACHLYLSGRRVWSYVFATGCLLCYETFFPVFLAIPPVAALWDRRLVRSLAKHAAFMAGILFADLLIRRLTGEGRVMSLSIGVAFSLLNHMVFGPIAVVARFIHTPGVLIGHVTRDTAWELGIAFVLACVFFTWAIGRYRREVTGPLPGLLKPAAVGLAMLVLAYAFTATTDPAPTSGRETRIHAPAALGAAILGACAASAALALAAKYRHERLAITALGAVFAVLFCLALTVQADFTRAWSRQREFWTPFVCVSPTLDDGDVFLIDPMKDTDDISAFSWSMAMIPENLFEFPGSWKNPPRAFLFPRDATLRDCSSAALFEAVPWVPMFLPEIVAGYRDAPLNFKRLRMQNGNQIESLNPCSGKSASRIGRFKTKPMYRYLIVSEKK